MSHKSSKIISVLSYMLIVLILVAVVGAIVYFTNGFTTDFTTFYVVIDGEDILTSKGGYCISIDNPLEVQVKYTMGFANEELSGYSFEIQSKPDVKFEYSVDGESMDFQGDIDWNKCFDIIENETSFTITPKASSIQKILSFAYPRQNVEIVDENIDSLVGDLFSLTIYSYNKEASITIEFGLYARLESVALDKTEIVF